MEWKKEYNLGIKVVDDQHKHLVSIVNDYKNSLSDHDVDSNKKIAEIVVYLTKYTTFHFKTEEDIMLSIKYPKIEEHKLIHKELINDIKKILLKFKNKESYTPIEFYYFLMGWLNDHILIEDKKLYKYCLMDEFTSTPKIILKNPESALVEINEAITSLNSGNNDSGDKIITVSDKFKKYTFGNIESVKNVIFVLSKIENISHEERKQLYFSLNIDSNVKKIELISDDKANLLAINDLIKEILN